MATRCKGRVAVLRHNPKCSELPSLGGPIITAGGVVFIAGTTDSFIRGFDVENGSR